VSSQFKDALVFSVVGRVAALAGGGAGLWRARPVYQRKRDSIEAHLTTVFAALAVTRFIEHRPAGQSGNLSAPLAEALLHYRD
jgi:hypothetical protein